MTPAGVGAPLQKWLQGRGAGSRRAVREAIRDGRVTVNDVVITRYAEPVEDDDVITFDGVVVPPLVDRIVLLMHKPKKHITALESTDGRDALGQYLPDVAGHVFPVGRLDFNTEGALLLTNDGELARRLLHPDWKVPKRYGIKIRGHLDNDHAGLQRFREGMTVEGVSYQPAEAAVRVLRTRATWVDVTIREGKFRQLRKMCFACGYQIVKLRREAIGPIELGDLNPRCVRALSSVERIALYTAVGLPAPTTQKGD